MFDMAPIKARSHDLIITPIVKPSLIVNTKGLQLTLPVEVPIFLYKFSTASDIKESPHPSKPIVKKPDP